MSSLLFCTWFEAKSYFLMGLKSVIGYHCNFKKSKSDLFQKIFFQLLSPLYRKYTQATEYTSTINFNSSENHLKVIKIYKHDEVYFLLKNKIRTSPRWIFVMTHNWTTVGLILGTWLHKKYTAERPTPTHKWWHEIRGRFIHFFFQL